MKTSLWRRRVARTVLVTFTSSVLASGHALGQTPPAPPVESPPPLSKQELRDLVAPVGLYPDVVLSSLLPATTFPDQLHQAAEFVGQAEQVDTVPTDRGWDGGVVGLLQFPDVVRWLDSNPAWTAQMGEAVTYQQGDVLDAIQDYRREVANAGNLKSNQYQKVRAVPDRDIVIEPARPDIVYVPSYDPVLATQPQPAVVQESPGINPWLAFGGGAVVGALGAWALYSIFDDDDDDGGNYYGRRRIRGYGNYYYARGRRPQAAVWTPRPRAYRDRPQGWQRPQRLRYASPSQKAAKRAALRPPMTSATAQAPPAARVRQQQRQEKQQVQQQQRQEKQQVQKQQRQERQQVEQQRRQQKQQVQRQQRQEKQGRRQEQRQRKQAQPHLRKQRQEQRQVRQGQRQHQRQQQQVQRQQRQQTQAGGGGRNANPNAKRKKGQGKNQ
jgi:hypothetical protein